MLLSEDKSRNPNSLCMAELRSTVRSSAKRWISGSSTSGCMCVCVLGWRALAIFLDSDRENIESPAKIHLIRKSSFSPNGLPAAVDYLWRQIARGYSLYMQNNTRAFNSR